MLRPSELARALSGRTWLLLVSARSWNHPFGVMPCEPAQEEGAEGADNQEAGLRFTLPG